MVATAKVIHLSPQTNLDRLLENAIEKPVLLEKNGVVFRLSREPDAIHGALAEDREPPAPRGEHETSVEYFDRIRAFIMRGRVFEDDSTELLRESREERTAELP